MNSAVANPGLPVGGANPSGDLGLYVTNISENAHETEKNLVCIGQAPSEASLSATAEM